MQYFSYIVAVSFIGEGNWSTREKTDLLKVTDKLIGTENEYVRFIAVPWNRKSLYVDTICSSYLFCLVAKRSISGKIKCSNILPQIFSLNFYSKESKKYLDEKSVLRFWITGMCCADINRFRSKRTMSLS